MSLNVRVITPDKVVWDAMADELILASSTGQVGILTGHAPLLTALDIGVMRFIEMIIISYKIPKIYKVIQLMKTYSLKLPMDMKS